MALHVHCKSLYISVTSTAKQQREIAKFCLLCRTRTAEAYYFHFYVELNMGIAYLAWAKFETDTRLEQI